jgi:F-type H+-transporting ATPase subunit epsilon
MVVHALGHEAVTVVARTTEGDVGILPNHAPMLAVLVPGAVEVRTPSDEYWVAYVDGGFLSVAHNRISVLAEHAEMSHEIDLEKAKHELERVQTSGELVQDAEDAVRQAQARIRAVEKAK